MGDLVEVRSGAFVCYRWPMATRASDTGRDDYVVVACTLVQPNQALPTSVYPARPSSVRL